MRVKRGFKARRRRNRVLKQASGYYSARSRQYKDAVEQVHNAWQDAYAHRKLRKREFRKLWIARINAAARALGISYSQLIGKLSKNQFGLDRKALSELAIKDPGGFKAVVDSVNK